MATSLGTLALGTYTNGSSTAAQGSDPLLEVIASLDDADYVYDATNSSHTGLAWFTLGDTPADFFSIATLAINLRYHWATGTQTNTWDSLTAQIYASDQTTALTNVLTVASTITTTTATNSGATSFTINSTGLGSSKTTWDGAYVAIRFNISKVKGGDTIQKRVTAAEVTGTYDTYTPKLLASLGVG